MERKGGEWFVPELDSSQTLHVSSYIDPNCMVKELTFIEYPRIVVVLHQRLNYHGKSEKVLWDPISSNNRVEKDQFD